MSYFINPSLNQTVEHQHVIYRIIDGCVNEMHFPEISEILFNKRPQTPSTQPPSNHTAFSTSIEEIKLELPIEKTPEQADYERQQQELLDLINDTAKATLLEAQEDKRNLSDIIGCVYSKVRGSGHFENSLPSQAAYEIEGALNSSVGTLIDFSSNEQKNQVVFEKVLGAGVSGEVGLFTNLSDAQTRKGFFSIFNKATGQQYAVKEGPRVELEGDYEIGMKLGESPYFTHVIGMLPPTQINQSRLLMDLVRGDTAHKTGVNSMDELKTFLKDLDKAYDYAFQRGVIPEDVHLNNMMIQKDKNGVPHLVIIDLGRFYTFSDIENEKDKQECLVFQKATKLKPRACLINSLQKKLINDRKKRIKSPLSQVEKIAFNADIAELHKMVSELENDKNDCLNASKRRQISWEQKEKVRAFGLVDKVIRKMNEINVRYKYSI